MEGKFRNKSKKTRKKKKKSKIQKIQKTKHKTQNKTKSINFTRGVGDTFKKGDEYGYFAFGGSTVILVFEPNKVKFDDDLLITSDEHIVETVIAMGDGIGNAVN